MVQNFWEGIERFQASCALIYGEKRMSYHELVEQAESLNKFLQSRTLCFLFAENNLESIIGYIAMLRKKVVPIMINPNIDNDLYRTLAEIYKPQYIWGRKLLPASEGYYKKKYSLYQYTLFESAEAQGINVAEELGLLLTTSGSTGSPKLVRQSYANLVSNANSIADYLEISEKDIPITTLPMYYTYGLSIINSHLLRGAAIVLNESSIMNSEFWAKIKTHQVSTFGGVPFTYESLLKLRFDKMDMPSLKILTQAGGKLSADYCKKYEEICKEKGIKFIIMYGQTEATARMSYLPWDKLSEKPGSIGIAIPGGKFELIDESGNPVLKQRQVGELVYKGENVTLGYAENIEDLSREDDRHGILMTGDLAFCDEEGYYYIVGRKKRFLKIYGSRMNLDEIEGLINGQGIEAACTGKDDCLKIYVTNDDCRIQISEWLEQHLHINRRAIQIKIIEEIPRNEAGKVLYSKLC